MVEVVGDSSREGRWALVRLTLDGDRIVSAEAEGLARPLEGLTLLEAAAVGGDELAVDALANALGPVFRASPRPGRVAVAMSGGGDNAVAPPPAAPARSGSRPGTTRGPSAATAGSCWRAPATHARTSRTCSPGSTHASS